MPTTLRLASRFSLLRLLALPALLILGTAGLTHGASRPAQQPGQRILVFSKTAGFRHESIEAGIAAIKKLGAENGISVDATEDAAAFTDANLKKYRAVVFLSTTGDVLNDPQQDALQRYVEAGGGWVGIHSATDTEYDWPWYGKLAGAYFASHPQNPNVRKANFRVLDKSHVSTQGLPSTWPREDEFYNFRNISPDIHVLVDIDETSYQGGTNGANHPMSWYHDFDGGRAWYTNMGHTDATFTEAPFLKHLLGGLRYAMATKPLDYSRAKPEENRFTKVVLAENLAEPVELAVLPGDRILFVQRHGDVLLYSPATKATKKLGTIPVSHKYTSGDEAEDGLLGLAADPNFARNGFLYMYYSPVDGTPRNQLVRFTMKGDAIDLEHPKVMLEIPVQREQCCHTAGSIAFDAHGNLFMSTGDNTNPHATGYAPVDEREGRGPWDAQKGSANTNDLRGKIIRIHPEPDGSYTIPDGNLFPKGTAKTRPEIYTMGHRNPYRISVDKHTGFLYWGEVGPDASADSAQRGPMGYDEVNQAKKPGNYGWPYFVADNKAYFDYDFATKTPGPQFDPAHPVNDSPNNTGLRDLPPAQKPMFWYPAGKSTEFPLVGTGGRTAMAGPVFHRADFRLAPRVFPAYYDGKFFAYEWMRGWIMAVTLDARGDMVSMERFMPSTKFSNPIDLEFSPSGDMYMLEYGTGWFQGNPDARLVRIEYNGGNRAPVVVADVDKPAGPLPLTVALSSEGTADADADALHYEWTITGPGGVTVAKISSPHPRYTFANAGVYTATLAVTDAKGAKSTAQTRIVAGNEPPQVALDVEGNSSFYFPGTPIRYATRVTDREDGSLESGGITADRVTVTAEYLKDGPPAPDTASGHRSAPKMHPGRALIEAGTCLSCHQIDRKSIGPAYNDVAAKYRNDAGALARLATKIGTGGSGVWGEVMMPPHPQLTEAQRTQMAAYILSLGAKKSGPSLPAKGQYTPPAATAESNVPGGGAVVLRAEYTDKGANGLPGAEADKTVVLRAPILVLATGELGEGVSKMQVPQLPVPITMPARSGTYVRFKQLDLTGISEIVFGLTAPAQYGAIGGKIEVHTDAADGTLIGETETVQAQQAQNAPPIQARATLKPTTGMHDLYFVFKSEKAEGMPFIAMTATFVNGASTPANAPATAPPSTGER
jgi:cytochrome c